MGYKEWTDKPQDDSAFLKAMGLKPNHKFLDVGCGGGRLGKDMISYLDDSNYYAFDKESRFISSFNGNIASRSKYQLKNPTVLNTDFESLKFDGNIEFDFVYAYSVFTHLKPDSIGVFLSKLLKYSHNKTVVFATVCFHPSTTTFKIMGGSHSRHGEFVEVFYSKDFFQAILNSVGYEFTGIDNFSGYIGPGNARVNPNDEPKYFGQFADIGSFQQMIRITRI